MTQLTRCLGLLAGALALIMALSGCAALGGPAPSTVAQNPSSVSITPSPPPTSAATAAPSPTATVPPTATATATASPSATATATASATFSPTSTPTISRTPTATSSPTQTPTATVTPTPTPHPLTGYTIEGLRARGYPGGTIEVRSTLTVTEAYTRYYISYPSDDPSAALRAGPSPGSEPALSLPKGQRLTITGVLHVPKGEGPFPVVILNHGYIAPASYWSGADTWRAADYLARQGYLTIAPDFRGWGGSDSGDNFFRGGLVIDVLNLISSLPSLPEADPNRVGMWGHSMGGGATTKAITVDPRIKAAVLYAPVSADDTTTMRRWGSSTRGGLDAGDPLRQAYRAAVRDRAFLRLTSPINYFDFVTAAVQIHQGTADTTTPPEWAEAIRDALQAAGKEVEYFAYPGQGHAFGGQSWTLFMERITAFYDRYLKGE